MHAVLALGDSNISNTKINYILIYQDIPPLQGTSNNILYMGVNKRSTLPVCVCDREKFNIVLQKKILATV